MKNMIKSLQELQLAFEKVNKEWGKCDKMNELVKSEYPFNKSFDELNLEVQKWASQSIEELENK